MALLHLVQKYSFYGKNAIFIAERLVNILKFRYSGVAVLWFKGSIMGILQKS